MDGCPLLDLPGELLAMVLAAIARLRHEDPGAMFRTARACRRLHRAALSWICYVSPSIFTSCGPGLVLVDDDRGVTQTKDQTDAFALAGPVLRSGTASTTFRFDVSTGIAQIGVFPVDQQLDSSIFSADGKRCALLVGSDCGGSAQVLCDGEESYRIENIGWRPGDKIKVDVTFTDTTTARVTFHCSRVDLFNLFSQQRYMTQTLKGVPACGLCFGAGRRRAHGRPYGAALRQSEGVTLVASSVDAGVSGEAAADAEVEQALGRCVLSE